jgi:hypothetical protein
MIECGCVCVCECTYVCMSEYVGVSVCRCVSEREMVGTGTGGRLNISFLKIEICKSYSNILLYSPNSTFYRQIIHSYCIVLHINAFYFSFFIYFILSGAY